MVHPEALISEFNDRYFVVNEDGKAMIWQPTRDATLDNPVYYLRSRPSDLKMFYMNCLIEVCTVGMVSSY